MTDYRDFQGYGQGTSDPRHADPYRATAGNSGLLIALAAIALLAVGVFVYAGGPTADRQRPCRRADRPRWRKIRLRPLP